MVACFRIFGGVALVVAWLRSPHLKWNQEERTSQAMLLFSHWPPHTAHETSLA